MSHEVINQQLDLKDVVYHIQSFLPIVDLSVCHSVNKTWRDVSLYMFENQRRKFVPPFLRKLRMWCILMLVTLPSNLEKEHEFFRTKLDGLFRQKLSLQDRVNMVFPKLHIIANIMSSTAITEDLLGNTENWMALLDPDLDKACREAMAANANIDFMNARKAIERADPSDKALDYKKWLVTGSSTVGQFLRQLQTIHTTKKNASESSDQIFKVQQDLFDEFVETVQLFNTYANDPAEIELRNSYKVVLINEFMESVFLKSYRQMKSIVINKSVSDLSFHVMMNVLSDRDSCAQLLVLNNDVLLLHSYENRLRALCKSLRANTSLVKVALHGLWTPQSIADVLQALNDQNRITELYFEGKVQVIKPADQESNSQETEEEFVRRLLREDNQTNKQQIPSNFVIPKSVKTLTVIYVDRLMSKSGKERVKPTAPATTAFGGFGFGAVPPTATTNDSDDEDDENNEESETEPAETNILTSILTSTGVEALTTVGLPLCQELLFFIQESASLKTLSIDLSLSDDGPLLVQLANSLSRSPSLEVFKLNPDVQTFTRMEYITLFNAFHSSIAKHRAEVMKLKSIIVYLNDLSAKHAIVPLIEQEQGPRSIAMLMDALTLIPTLKKIHLVVPYCKNLAMLHKPLNLLLERFGPDQELELTFAPPKYTVLGLPAQTTNNLFGDMNSKNQPAKWMSNDILELAKSLLSSIVDPGFKIPGLKLSGFMHHDMISEFLNKFLRSNTEIGSLCIDNQELLNYHLQTLFHTSIKSKMRGVAGEDDIFKLLAAVIKRNIPSLKQLALHFPIQSNDFLRMCIALTLNDNIEKVTCTSAEVSLAGMYSGMIYLSQKEPGQLKSFHLEKSSSKLDKIVVIDRSLLEYTSTGSALAFGGIDSKFADFPHLYSITAQFSIMFPLYPEKHWPPQPNFSQLATIRSNASTPANKSNEQEANTADQKVEEEVLQHLSSGKFTLDSILEPYAD